MGRITIVIPDELERALRKRVSDRLGMRKGNLSRAIIEAVKLWVEMGWMEDKGERTNERV